MCVDFLSSTVNTVRRSFREVSLGVRVHHIKNHRTKGVSYKIDCKDDDVLSSVRKGRKVHKGVT